VTVLVPEVLGTVQRDFSLMRRHANATVLWVFGVRNARSSIETGVPVYVKGHVHFTTPWTTVCVNVFAIEFVQQAIGEPLTVTVCLFLVIKCSLDAQVLSTKDLPMQ